VARRTMTMLLAAALALLVAAPAQATLVYVKDPGELDAHVWVARDDGSKPRRIGPGHSPTVSPDGRWVAWVASGSPDRIMMRLADRSRKARVVARSAFVGELRFSPDSRSLAFVRSRRLFVYDIRERRAVKAASGEIRGFSFSPDSGAIVFGTAGRNDAVDAPSDLYYFTLAERIRRRITRDRKSLNPLWGPAGIVHDRMNAREGDAPSYNVFSIQPDGGSLRRITSLRIPSLVSGLVPVELSANGKRLLANFVGQNTQVAFRVNTRTGKTKALDDDFENGLVGFDLSADGRTVLGHTGGPDPGARHHVVTVPYGGGEPEILVRRAGFPDWSL
jgi:dipeptidyl aminopeptidase/acylaminoacyl peptidase